nr:hypothetical protein CFP56_32109 [Quercus suber]
MGVDPSKSLIAEVDEKVLHSHREHVNLTPREDDEDASMGKISKKNGRDPSKEVQWCSVIDDALVDVFLHQSKPAAKKWMTTPIPNYSKMAQLWAKDRAKSDHVETAKEKRDRYATSTTINEIDNLISQNEVSLENFEAEDDQRSS